MPKSKQAMILAAGVGSRLSPLTNSLPKPLAPILGKPVMEHIISLCKKHGFTDLCANVHVKAEDMRNHFSDSKHRLGVDLKLVHETELTGVAGGIRSCHKYLTNDVVLIMMGDAISDADLSYLYEKHLESGCEVTIGIMEINDTSQFGVIVTDENDRVISFQEKPKPEEAKSNLANTGIYLMNQKVLQEMPSFEEKPFYDVAKDLFPKLMSENRHIQAIKINGYWADIGSIKQYTLSLIDAIEGRVKIELPQIEKFEYGLKATSTKIDSTVKIDGKVFFGKNVVIGQNVILKGYVFIEENTVIEDGSVIENSVIWKDSFIGSKSKVKNCIVCNECKVGVGESISNSVWAPGTLITSASEPSKMLS